MTSLDRLSRPLRDLRLSVTDRCNFRCTYCMPADEYEWIERSEVLSFEEMERLATIFAGLGVGKIRVTGGEPLVRKNVERLIERLAGIPGLEDLSMTTNGALLAEKADLLRDAGLRRVNISLDSLDRERFRRMTQRDDLERVLAGIEAARKAGLGPIKLNVVVVRGVNEDEVLPMAEFGRSNGHEVRFIEYMDVGTANDWSLEKTYSKREILEAIRSKFELREVGRADGRAPAVDYQYADGAGRVGVIGSVTEPFCGTCTRARMTAEGKLVTCLFAHDGFDLKALLRGGASDEEIHRAIEGVWSRRLDRYSEDKWQAIRAGRGSPEADRRRIEMIRLGG